MERRIRQFFRREKIGAILVEPIQARGGCNVLPPEFLPLLRKLCDEHGALLIKGPNVMLGYWKNPDLTATRIRDGWVHTGDIGRIQRQQQYMAALMHEVVRPTTLLNPLRVFALARAGTSSVIVGSGDGPLATARLGMAMRGLSSGKGAVATVPISNPDGTSDVGSVVVWDKKAAAELFSGLGAA